MNKRPLHDLMDHAIRDWTEGESGATKSAMRWAPCIDADMEDTDHDRYLDETCDREENGVW